ncbi:MAG: hypothetical protein Kow00108_24640 [Calditrichia bacterium]
MRYRLYLLFFLLPTFLVAKDWKMFETEHFRVVYYPGVEQTAFKAASIAEEIYTPVTDLYNFKPESKTWLIFKDTEDYSNGGAYYFENKIEIWAENLDFVLRGTHHWLSDVITHEFIHIISIRKAMKMGKHIPGIYFQFFSYEKEKREDVVRGFPNVVTSVPYIALNYPVWFAEGVSQYQTNAKRYDYRDSQREMILRDRILTGNLLTLEEMSTFGKNSIGNESAYNQGFALVKYIAETYGEDKLGKIAARAQKITDFTFDQSVKAVLGKSLKQIYDDWKQFLENKYNRQISFLKTDLVSGEPVEDKGFGNLYPVFSPDGRAVAYVTNKDNIWFGQNALIIAKKVNGHWEKEEIDKFITSSFSWSPDGRYLAYSKQIENIGDVPKYNDLYVYDLQEKRKYRITKNMRFRHPDWNPVTNKIVGVVSHDGNTNLVELEINPERLDESNYQEFGFHILKHEILSKKEMEKLPGDSLANYHHFGIKSDNWKYLTQRYDGMQFFHPRWSPDGQKIAVDFSTEFTRNIAIFDAKTMNITSQISGLCDYRNPFWHPSKQVLYFASDTSGIFNIYKKDLISGEITAVTNVTGGAFSPSVSEKGAIVYSLYKNQGFNIYMLPENEDINPEDIVAIPEYFQHIIHRKDKIVSVKPEKIKSLKPRSTNILVFPKIMIDYGTVKPGFYFYMPEVLNRLEVMGTFDINKDKDIFYYLQFGSNVFKKRTELEVFNQISNVEEDFRFPLDTAKANVRFNLMEIRANVHLGKLNVPWLKLLKPFKWNLSYAYSQYEAVISPLATRTDIYGNVITFPTFRYTYLKGHKVMLNTSTLLVKNTLERNINPQNGFYLGLNSSFNANNFLVDFSSSQTSLEQFKLYKYVQLLGEFELYYQNPLFKNHTFDLKIQAGYTDRKIDDFFHFYAGGLLGLKGYSYYSLEGRNMLLISYYYRFPLLRNINKKIGVAYLKHLYLAPFFQHGNAWDGPFSPDFNEFKRNAGLQVRLNLFSYYFVPLSVFYEYAVPLDDHVARNINYKKQARHYFGILFDFDIRMTSRKGNSQRRLF